MSIKQPLIDQFDVRITEYLKLLPVLGRIAALQAVNDSVIVIYQWLRQHQECPDIRAIETIILLHLSPLNDAQKRVALLCIMECCKVICLNELQWHQTWYWNDLHDWN